ncbi:MAG: DNA-processing protein DprA [Candidatus Paceibacterota bacterium]|jgi:DNA processing protein
MHIFYPDLPNSLKNIPDPPNCLFYRGDLSLIYSDNIIAVIGSRNYSQAGNKSAIELTELLTKEGYIVVSGLALGIDAIAHQTTINNRGKTIAVLGSGIDDKSFYPKQNLSLAKRIIDNNGLILSEYAPKIKPHRQHFLKRNRIIVGLSKAIIVADVKEKSGTMASARLGLKSKKTVFMSSNVKNKQLLDLRAIDITNNSDIINLLTKYAKRVN